MRHSCVGPPVTPALIRTNAIRVCDCLFVDVFTWNKVVLTESVTLRVRGKTRTCEEHHGTSVLCCQEVNVKFFEECSLVIKTFIADTTEAALVCILCANW